MNKEAGTIEWSGNAEMEEYDCVWIIRTSAGKHVQILFTHLSLPDTTCGNDYLKVSGIQRKTKRESLAQFGNQIKPRMYDRRITRSTIYKNNLLAGKGVRKLVF